MVPGGSAAAGGSQKGLSVLTRGGAEIPVYSRLRISPFGQGGAVGKNGVGKNIPASLPHYHYAPKGAPKKAMKLHRPWETLFKKWF